MRRSFAVLLIVTAALTGSCGSGGAGPGSDSTPGSGTPAEPDTSVEPISGSEPKTRVFPKSPPPADRIHAIDLSRFLYLLDQNQETIAFMTLAGLVNRSQPAIYLASSPADPWLDWMRERGDIEAYEWLSNPYELFARYGARTNGLVVIDPGIAATYNVACVVAACEGLIACHPGYVSRIQQHNPALKVVRDLREERFAHNGEAYAWAYEMYWSEMRHDILAWMDTSFRPTGPRDYCVAHKIFPLWVNRHAIPWEPGINVKAEQQFAEKLLRETPENIPMLGWPGITRGMGEHAGIELWSRYGKYAVVEGDLAGLSFHSGCSPVSLDTIPPAAPPDFDIDRVYYATYHSEGEVLWQDNSYRGPWEQASRGQVPYGWSIGLLQRELIPAILDWFLRGDGSSRPIQPGDELVSAMSGLGYVFPHQLPDKARKGFLNLTKSAMASNKITTLAIHFNNAPYCEKKRIAGEYGERLGSSAHAIFADYAYNPGTAYGMSNYLSNGVPTFHSLAPRFKREGNPPEDIAREFDQRLHDRGAPAFGEIFLMGWSSSPNKAVQVRDNLEGLAGDLYVPVRPDHLGILYKKSGAGIELDFFDNFSAGHAQWTVESGRWASKAGTYTQEETAQVWHASRAGNCQWDNVAVSALLRNAAPSEKAGMAVFGRFRGINNAYYRFELWRDSKGSYARLFKKRRGESPRLLLEVPYEKDLTRDTLLEMVLHCDTIVCSIDDSQVIRIVDADPIPRGWVALGSYGSKTIVDEVLVERSAACVDCDGDGYGEPGDAACPGGEAWDCDDYDDLENPGGREGPRGDRTCFDGLDNDCDGLFDQDDPGCA